MNTCPKRGGGPIDRPLLRVFSPELADAELTVAEAHKTLREPELANRSRGYRLDCARAIAAWSAFESSLQERQRITYPLPLSAITSSILRAFQEWLGETTCLSPSVRNKYVREVLTTIKLAADEGIEVRPVRCRRLPEPTGAKIWLDELQVACLWAEAEAMTWPPRDGSRAFGGTGVSPATWWRAVLILLRVYGMRVQDLVAYQRGKSPVTWADITFDGRTPNPHGREEWPLGWMYYQSSKVGRKYYLPLTKYTRAAVDRLRAGAVARATAAGLADVPGDWPILPCPRGGALPRWFKRLCAAARVAKPIKLLGVEASGDKWVARTSVSERVFPTEAAARAWLAVAADYVLEDFRSTAATFYAAIEESLPNKVCGWAEGAKANVGRKNYINDEPVLIKYMPAAPMPRCFDDWI